MFKNSLQGFQSFTSGEPKMNFDLLYTTVTVKSTQYSYLEISLKGFQVFNSVALK